MAGAPRTASSQMAWRTSSRSRHSRYATSTGSSVWSSRRKYPSTELPTHSMARTTSIGSPLHIAGQDAEDLVVDLTVAGKRVGAMDVELAVPVAESAACLLDDGDDRGDVPGVDA